MITLAFLRLDRFSTADWALLTLVLLLSLFILAAYTISLYNRMPKHDTPLIGHEAVVVSWSGRDQRVEVFGAIWQAQLPAHHQVRLQTGDLVRVRSLHNLVLTITPIGESA